ncbi:MAG: hypothetical protein GWO04_07000, partial [Actinobacteria bacterium]|nr:hypothetical protein [Actinomycetota bacterium]
VAAGVIHFIYLAGDTSMTVVILQAELGMGMPIAPLLQPQDGPQRPRRGRGADRIPGNPF